MWQRCDQSIQNLAWRCRMGLNTNNHWKFRLLEIQDGRWLPSWKSNHHNCLIDFDEIWHRDAFWPSRPRLPFKSQMLYYNNDNLVLRSVLHVTLQRTSTGVDIFFSLMRSYFCFLFAACSVYKMTDWLMAYCNNNNNCKKITIMDQQDIAQDTSVEKNTKICSKTVTYPSSNLGWHVIGDQQYRWLRWMHYL